MNVLRKYIKSASNKSKRTTLQRLRKIVLIVFYKAKVTFNSVIECGIRDQRRVYGLSQLVRRGCGGGDAGSGVPGGDSGRPSLSTPVTLTWPEQLSQGARILPHLMEREGMKGGRQGQGAMRKGRAV